MAYVAPTAADLKARYPEFDAVSDGLIDLILADAIADVDSRWIEADRARAQLALAAHMLTLEGEPDRSLTIADGGTVSPLAGPIKRDKVGDVETEYFGASDSSGSSSSGGIYGYGSTKYGQQFLKLRARSHPSVIAV